MLALLIGWPECRLLLVKTYQLLLVNNYQEACKLHGFYITRRLIITRRLYGIARFDGMNRSITGLTCLINGLTPRINGWGAGRWVGRGGTAARGTRAGHPAIHEPSTPID